MSVTALDAALNQALVAHRCVTGWHGNQGAAELYDTNCSPHTHTHLMHLLLQISHMAQLLYLKKQGSEEVVAFELDEEFRLDEKTVLTHYRLKSLLIWQEDADVFVAVRFRPDGLSYKPFEPNTKQHPLVVKDEPGQLSPWLQYYNQALHVCAKPVSCACVVPMADPVGPLSAPGCAQVLMQAPYLSQQHAQGSAPMCWSSFGATNMHSTTAHLVFCVHLQVCRRVACGSRKCSALSRHVCRAWPYPCPLQLKLFTANPVIRPSCQADESMLSAHILPTHEHPSITHA